MVLPPLQEVNMEIFAEDPEAVLKEAVEDFSFLPVLRSMLTNVDMFTFAVRMSLCIVVLVSP